MKNRLEALSSFLNRRINSLCENDEFSKYRSFYGECFALSSLKLSGMLKDDVGDYLISKYRNKDKSHSEFHHEFNNYAMTTDETLSKTYSTDFYPLVFKNTPCTNWTLLRERVKLEHDSSYQLNEALSKISELQLESGLILDDPGVKSFQYHCFSMVMIAEMYLINKDEKLKMSFEKGVKFILPFISPTGEALYIGRGQNQSFGYSTLLYMLVLAQDIFEKSFETQIDKVLGLIEKQVKSFDDLPLMLNQNLADPYLVNMKDKKFYGWYPYNNYIDYFCFSSYFITKSFTTFKDSSKEKISFNKELTDSDFLVRNCNYFCVVSSSGGYLTNDLPIPFIQYHGESITPMYGGEQFQESLYSDKDIPLPINKLFNISIRKKSKSKLVNDTMIVKSPFGNLKRKYSFNKEQIVIDSEMLLPFLFKTPLLFFPKTEILDNKTLRFKNVEFKLSKPFKKKLSSLTPSGEMMKVEVEGEFSMEINFL